MITAATFLLSLPSHFFGRSLQSLLSACLFAAVCPIAIRARHRKQTWSVALSPFSLLSPTPWTIGSPLPSPPLHGRGNPCWWQLSACLGRVRACMRCCCVSCCGLLCLPPFFSIDSPPTFFSNRAQIGQLERLELFFFLLLFLLLTWLSPFLSLSLFPPFLQCSFHSQGMVPCTDGDASGLATRTSFFFFFFDAPSPSPFVVSSFLGKMTRTTRRVVCVAGQVLK